MSLVRATTSANLWRRTPFFVQKRNYEFTPTLKGVPEERLNRTAIIEYRGKNPQQNGPDGEFWMVSNAPANRLEFLYIFQRLQSNNK